MEKKLNRFFENVFWKGFAFSSIALSGAFCESPLSLIAVEEPQNIQNFSIYQNNSSEPEQVISKHSKVQIGASYNYFTLKPKGHDTFHGNLGGLQASYEFMPLNNWYGGIVFNWKEGSSHNDDGKRSLLYFDVQERFGYTFAFNKKKCLLTLFSGFAYRYMGENFDPKHGKSLNFGYNEFYFPVGFLTDYRAYSWFCCGINFLWMPQVFSTVSIDPLKGTYWNITKQLDNFLVEIPLTFTLTKNKRFFLVVKPTYQHWQDGHSTAKTASGLKLGLPENTYNFYGIDLNFAYRF